MPGSQIAASRPRPPSLQLWRSWRRRNAASRRQRTRAGARADPASIIDQHFAECGRIGRLSATVAHRPDRLGIGIDEDTALHVEGCIARAIGSGGVRIADASRASHSNAADAKPATYFRSTARLCTHRGAATASAWPRAAPQHGLCRRLSVPRCAPRKDNANRVRRPALNIAGPPTHRRDARASGSRCRRGQRRAR